MTCTTCGSRSGASPPSAPTSSERVLADGRSTGPLDEPTVRASRPTARAAHPRGRGGPAPRYRHPDTSGDPHILLEECPALHVCCRTNRRRIARVERASTRSPWYVLEVTDRYLSRLEDDWRRWASAETTGHHFQRRCRNGGNDARFPVRLIESGPAPARWPRPTSAADRAAATCSPSHGRYHRQGACLIEDGHPTVAQTRGRPHAPLQKGSDLPIKASSVEWSRSGRGRNIARTRSAGLVVSRAGFRGATRASAVLAAAEGAQVTTRISCRLSGPQLLPWRSYATRRRCRTHGRFGRLPSRSAIDRAGGLAVHPVVTKTWPTGSDTRGRARPRARNYPLFAFGGAGAGACVRVAQELGVRE